MKSWARMARRSLTLAEPGVFSSADPTAAI